MGYEPNIIEIVNHRMVDVEYREAADKGGPMDPEAIVLHYSAGSSLEGDVEWLTRKDEHYLSAHLIIGRDGTIVQTVPFDRVAYHAGSSAWKGRSALNGWSVGIEMTNYGWVQPDGAGRFTSWSGQPVDPAWVESARHKNGWPRYRYWEKFRDVQIQRCIDACASLLKAYPGIKWIVGHDDVAPQRKQDPGPLFPLEWVRKVALDAARPQAHPRADEKTCPNCGYRL